MINITSIQYPVGQGGLHLSIINYKEQDKNKYFVYIYDCGAKNSIKTNQVPINEFKEKILEIKKQITHFYIFISHFHLDHYNYLSEVLNFLSENINNNKIIKKLILPYLTPLSKILFICDTEWNEDNNQYISFIKDPQEYLNSNWQNLNIEVQYINNDEDNGFNSNNSNMQNIPCNTCMIPKDKMFSHYNKWDFRINRQVVWILKPFVKLLKGNQLEVLLEEFEKVFQIDNCTELLELIDSDKENNIINQIKDIYQNANIKSRDFNNTSLCLYSGLPDFHRSNSNINNEFNTNSAWLHTGDINLKNTYKEFVEHYEKNLCNVYVFQIPHHGSNNNIDDVCKLYLLGLFNKNSSCITCKNFAKKENIKFYFTRQEKPNATDPKSSVKDITKLTKIPSENIIMITEKSNQIILNTVVSNTSNICCAYRIVNVFK